MELEVVAPVEPLDVKVGGEVVRIFLDVSIEGQRSIAQRSLEGSKELAALEALLSDAKVRGDEEAKVRIHERMTKVIRDTLVPIISEDSYERIADAATGGRRELRHLTTNTFAQVMQGITKLLAQVQDIALRYVEENGNMTATRDTQEGDVAQPIADEAAD